MSPQFVVSDLNKSLQFYTKELAFDINFRHEDFYAGIGCNGHSIHLKIGRPAKGERERRRKDEDLDIYFGVTDIESYYENILTRDIEVIQPLREMPYGKEFYIIDPDGYILGFKDVTE